jgi:hypothetical protein
MTDYEQTEMQRKLARAERNIGLWQLAWAITFAAWLVGVVT